MGALLDRRAADPRTLDCEDSLPNPLVLRDRLARTGQHDPATFTGRASGWEPREHLSTTRTNTSNSLFTTRPPPLPSPPAFLLPPVVPSIPLVTQVLRKRFTKSIASWPTISDSILGLTSSRSFRVRIRFPTTWGSLARLARKSNLLSPPAAPAQNPKFHVSRCARARRRTARSTAVRTPPARVGAIRTHPRTRRRPWRAARVGATWRPRAPFAPPGPLGARGKRGEPVGGRRCERAR